MKASSLFLFIILLLFTEISQAGVGEGVSAIGTLSSLTATSVENNNGLPASFKLHQNFPNPFNPATQITYELPESEFVSLKVYDAIGNEVAVLVNEIKSAGIFTSVFNAEQYSSGIYLVRFKAGYFSESIKISLLK